MPVNNASFDTFKVKIVWYFTQGTIASYHFQISWNNKFYIAAVLLKLRYKMFYVVWSKDDQKKEEIIRWTAKKRKKFLDGQCSEWTHGQRKVE